jgi:hypothetical protein
VAEIHRIYLDQMFRLDVAEELRNQGYDGFVLEYYG